MSSNIEKIKQEVLQLSTNERALLAEHLISSLDDEEDLEAERFWVEEAERRYQEYKQGKVRMRPAEIVFKEARSRFK